MFANNSENNEGLICQKAKEVSSELIKLLKRLGIIVQNSETEWTFSPLMVETAYMYFKAAKILYPVGKLEQVAVINAALSLEILFKSYNSSTSSNEGELNEKYNFQKGKHKNIGNGHNLIQLYGLLPNEIKAKFDDDFTVDMLEKYKDTFITDRYFYEKNSSRSYSTILIGLAERFITETVTLYKEKGCDDLWIVNYPNV